MALQSLNGGFTWPDPVSSNPGLGSLSIGELAIDASGEKVGFVFQAPKTGNIDRVFAYVKTKTTNGTLDVRLETVDATTGQPTGTLVATNTSGTFSNTASDQAIDVTLTAVAPVVRGTRYALVISQNAGDCTIATLRWSFSRHSISGLCYSLQYLTGAWENTVSATARDYNPNCALRYDDTTYDYVPGAVCFSVGDAVGFNNGSATRERGLAFTLPFPVTVSGFYFMLGDDANTDVDVILAQTDGTALATFTLDKDMHTRYATYRGTMRGLFAATVDLAADTTYYLTVKPQGATTIYVIEFTLIAAIADMMGMWNGGTRAYLVTRDAGGAYTETTTQRPYGMGLIVSAFDDGAGGAGGALLRPVGLRGNLV